MDTIIVIIATVKEPKLLYDGNIYYNNNPLSIFFPCLFERRDKDIEESFFWSFFYFQCYFYIDSITKSFKPSIILVDTLNKYCVQPKSSMDKFHLDICPRSIICDY